MKLKIFKESMTTCVSSVFLLLLLTLPISHEVTYGHSTYELNQLEIIDIKIYDYDSTMLEDYHPEQEPLREILVGSGFVINSLVKNQNHTAEHFDFITEVFDKDGTVIYLNVRYGVAVPLGGQIPIDSARTPIVLNNTGVYLVEVFAWRHLNEVPVPLSHPAVGMIRVTE